MLGVCIIAHLLIGGLKRFRDEFRGHLWLEVLNGADAGESPSYWRLDTLYDDQAGVGILGDEPKDFKFQYMSAVYRDFAAGVNLYAIQGSLSLNGQKFSLALRHSHDLTWSVDLNSVVPIR